MLRIRTESPLFVWKLLLVVIVVAVLLIYRYEPGKFLLASSVNVWAERLKAVEFRQEERGIIFFGNSLLRAALPQNDIGITRELSKALSDSNQWNSIRAVNLAVGGRQASDLRKFGDQMISLRPAAIVIQAEVIVSRRIRGGRKIETSPLDRIRSWSQVLRAPFNRYLPGEKRQRKDRIGLNVLAAPAHMDVRWITKKTPAEIDPLENAKQMWSGQKVLPSDDEFLIGKQFIRKATSAGIQIFVIEMPVSETAAHLADPGYLRKRKSALRSMLRPLGGRLLSFPEILPDTHFIDYSHVNVSGRKKFSRWLIPVLARELRVH